MKSDKELLQDILVTGVLILSRLHAAEREADGVTRLGGDFTPEAISEIRRSRDQILQRLLSPS